MKRFRTNLLIGTIITIMLMIAFRWIALGVMNDKLNIMDSNIYNFVFSYQSGLMNRIMVFISFLGSASFLGIVAVMVFWILLKIKKHYWDSLFILFNPLGVWLVNKLLKSIYQRERPNLEHLDKVTGYSFPSGHAMVSFAFYGFLAYIAFLNIENRKLRYPIMAMFILLALSIGISRVYLGVHYASDIIGGFIGGGAWIVTCIAAHQGIRHYRDL
ncbi:MAG TPA: phosphatase PAP2 family protein [Clostridia bacterium]|nr:phosphatase PAP2 family protein [Clostridia bacterium]